MSTVKKIISWVGIVFFGVFGVAFISTIEDGSAIMPSVLAAVSFGIAFQFFRFGIMKRSSREIKTSPSKKQLETFNKEKQIDKNEIEIPNLKKPVVGNVETKKNKIEVTQIRPENDNTAFIELQKSLCLIPVDIQENINYAVKNNIEFPQISLTAIRSNSKKSTYGNYVVIDVETTGLSARDNEIIEIAAVKFIDFEPVETMATLVKPQSPIPPMITRINGISNKDVANAPQIHGVVDSFIDFIGDLPVVAHNLSFDFRFLHANHIDLTLHKRKYFDTLSMSRRALKKNEDIENHKLDTLCKYYGICREISHRSLSDCIATGIIFRNLVFDKLDE